jgi:hypothetical protein
MLLCDGLTPMSTAAAAKTSRVSDHRFYAVSAIVFAAIVFIGFARTYYLKGYFGNPHLPLLLHIHGSVMTLWYAVFIVQVRLVAAHRVALHRKLGIAGIFLAGVVATLGATVSMGLAKRDLLAHPQSAAPPFLLGLQLFGIVLVFVILVTAAVHYRRRSDYHKRLMTLAMISTLGPAITRLPLHLTAGHNIPATIAIAISLVLICVIVDSVRNHRLQPAFGWGGAMVIGAIFVVAPLAQTATWVHFVRWWLTQS